MNLIFLELEFPRKSHVLELVGFNITILAKLYNKLTLQLGLARWV